MKNISNQFIFKQSSYEYARKILNIFDKLKNNKKEMTYDKKTNKVKDNNHGSAFFESENRSIRSVYNFNNITYHTVIGRKQFNREGELVITRDSNEQKLLFEPNHNHEVFIVDPHADPKFKCYYALALFHNLNKDTWFVSELYYSYDKDNFYIKDHVRGILTPSPIYKKGRTYMKLYKSLYDVNTSTLHCSEDMWRLIKESFDLEAIVEPAFLGIDTRKKSAEVEYYKKKHKK